MPRIESITNPAFRQGQGAKGPWTMMKVMVDGKEATGFAPLNVGDEVELEFNQQYQNWNAKKVRPAPGAASPDIKAQLDSIERKLDRLLPTDDNPDAPPFTDDQPPTTNYDEIPF